MHRVHPPLTGWSSSSSVGGAPRSRASGLKDVGCSIWIDAAATSHVVASAEMGRATRRAGPSFSAFG
jgi:hypothetical protein